MGNCGLWLVHYQWRGEGCNGKSHENLGQNLAETPKSWEDWESNRGHLSVQLYKSMDEPHSEACGQFSSLHACRRKEKETGLSRVNFYILNKLESSDSLCWSLKPCVWKREGMGIRFITSQVITSSYIFMETWNMLMEKKSTALSMQIPSFRCVWRPW